MPRSQIMYIEEKGRSEIVTRANLAKFSQHSELKRYLVGTKRRVLAEASPRDRIWGIGLEAKDPRVKNPLQWRGLNLLGFALMEVRRRLEADDASLRTPTLPEATVDQ